MMRAAAMLGVPPAGFWRLSLKEWRMLTDGSVNVAPMVRSDLMRMAEAWPDD
jgi:hypothetical protein